MTHERSHGKVRTIGPRLSDNKDHADGANAVDRDRDHEPGGRFKKGNRAAVGTGPKRTVKHLVPRRGWRLFEDLCSQLGSSGGVLAYLHASDAVGHQLDALDLAELARAAGLATPEGKDLHERAQRSSELVIRSATAALDAARLFKRPGAGKAKGRTPPGFEPEKGSE